MAKYKISGIWKLQGTISHYALHLVEGTSIYRGVKTTKSEAVRLFSNQNNRAITWIWNYQTASWEDGETVEVVSGSYLRTDPDNKLTDNLNHLINYEWLQSW